jgi:hypothetical protein
LPTLTQFSLNVGGRTTRKEVQLTISSSVEVQEGGCFNAKFQQFAPLEFSWKLIGVCKKYGLILPAMFLLVAALLKASDNGNSGLYSPSLKVLATYVEFIVGALLLLKWLPFFSWVFSCSLFFVFMIFGFNIALSGYSDCGCFGFVKMDLFITVLLDIFALLLLGIARPQFALQNPIKTTGSMMIFSGWILFAAFQLNGKNGDDLVAILSGSDIYITPTLVDLGPNSAGDLRVIRINVINRSNQSARLIGGSVNCKCTVLKDLPVTLPPASQKEIEIELLVRGDPGFFVFKYELFTDIKKEEKIFGVITGRILAPSPLTATD